MNHRLHALLADQGENYIAPFLWLHNEPDELILRELDRIYECGIRAVCLESRTHEEFCREDWWSDCRLILDYCRDHGMKAWILDDKHFPSGYANGCYYDHPELVQWNITEQHIDVAGPVKEGSAYAKEWLFSSDEELLGIFACRHIEDSPILSGEIIDLSNNLSDGYVYFDLPEGMWRIVYLIKTRRGLSEQYRHYSDKLSEESTEAYLQAVYEPHYANLSEYFGNVLLGFFSDEPAFGNNTANPSFKLTKRRIFAYHPWHESVRTHFASLYGKDAMRNLLALWFDFADLPYMDYRTAYMNFITDRYAEVFTAKIAGWCHDHGVEFIGHVIEDNNSHHGTVNSTGHYFKSLRAQDMAGIDVVLHQIIPGLTACNSATIASYREVDSKFFHYTLGKLASSLAHITPHMKGRAMCEIFGAYGWAEGTKIMKYLTDHMIVRGINYFVPHAFSPKPNDPDCPPNFYATGEHPQYRYFGHLMGYMNRLCRLFEGSIHVNTCAILYDAESAWSGADYLPLDDVAKVLYDAQLDYDILPPESLFDIDGDSRICGEEYRLLLVPQCDYLRKEVRNALADAVARTGGKLQVIAVADRPMDDLPTVSLADLPTYVRACNGDVQAEGVHPYLRYRHAILGGTHLYLFTNEDVYRTVDTQIESANFPGGQYVRYDVLNNQAVLMTGDKIALTLAPYESVAVLWGDLNTADIPIEQPTVTAEHTLTPRFEIALQERTDGEFVPYKTTDVLFSLTGRGERPRFSGIARYTAVLTLPENAAYLDLGQVGETAEVYLNGRPLGVRIVPPYRFDLSAIAREGENLLEIYTSNPLGYRIHDAFSRYLQLPPSGVLGPITIAVKQS